MVPVDLICTLEQAMKFRELGVLQHSYAAWIKNNCHEEERFRPRAVKGEGITNEGYQDHDGGCLIGYSAYTVSELSNMLVGVKGVIVRPCAFEFATIILAGIETKHFKVEAINKNIARLKKIRERQ